jgi:hypothetical protein
MKWLLGFAAGYVLGAHGDKEDFGDVARALRAVRDSTEMQELFATVRTHMGHALRGLADVVERNVDESTYRATATTVLGADLVDRVRRMVGEQ